MFSPEWWLCSASSFSGSLSCSTLVSSDSLSPSTISCKPSSSRSSLWSLSLSSWLFASSLSSPSVSFDSSSLSSDLLLLESLSLVSLSSVKLLSGSGELSISIDFGTCGSSSTGTPGANEYSKLSFVFLLANSCTRAITLSFIGSSVQFLRRIFFPVCRDIKK